MPEMSITKALARGRGPGRTLGSMLGVTYGNSVCIPMMSQIIPLSFYSNKKAWVAYTYKIACKLHQKWTFLPGNTHKIKLQNGLKNTQLRCEWRLKQKRSTDLASKRSLFAKKKPLFFSHLAGLKYFCTQPWALCRKSRRRSNPQHHRGDRPERETPPL